MSHAQEHSAQKQVELEASVLGAAELRTQAAELKADKERTEEAYAGCTHQLLQAQELLRSNQQVILEWGARAAAAPALAL